MEAVFRSERPAEASRIRSVVAAAFGRDLEADLVETLRKDGAATVSLVAEIQGAIAGHVLFSPVEVEDGLTAGALGPIAVAPSLQRNGIGTALAEFGIQRCRGRWPAVFVLGDPAFYGRLGFELAAPRGLHYESAKYDDAFQVRELDEGALDRHTGVVRYHPAFATTA